MSIQAITPIDSNKSLNSINNLKQNKQNFVPESEPLIPESIELENDEFENSNSPKMLEAKYDLACRLAAYYKTQYNCLTKDGSCVA